MREDVDNELHTFCRRLSKDFGEMLTWSWDERYDTIVGEFKRSDEKEVCDVLERHFSAIWDNDVIQSAHELEKKLCNQLGGLSPGQWLYTTDPHLGAVIYCAWWRWGDGRNASIRIGDSRMTLGAKADPATQGHFKACFDI